MKSITEVLKYALSRTQAYQILENDHSHLKQTKYCAECGWGVGEGVISIRDQINDFQYEVL